MSRKNMSNSFIKDCIVTALIDLMKEKDFNQITITEIANKAGVSRMAYYRYYTSKSDILNQYIDEVISSVNISIKLDYSENKMYVYFREMFEQLGKHREVGIEILKANLGELFLNSLTKNMFAIFGKENMTVRQKYELHLVIGGFASLFVHWLMGGCNESSDEMAQICCEILSYNGFINTVE
ncbi:MAG: TetR/AcrR family transcriptional regulator [Clostridia bacterium]|nr:TetR/AcrR family transcriptional regulator [Clostridia bacterium]